MSSTGIRQLKDNLSQIVRRVERGERVRITAHGRVVAELRPATSDAPAAEWFEALVDAGVVRPATEAGDPFAGWGSIKAARGTARRLIDEDRGEA
jgi:prevent-host-death family protein